MNKVLPPPSNSDEAIAAGIDLCAVLVLDASGNVVAANGSARQLWAVAGRSLVGLPLAGFFAGEAPVAADTDAAKDDEGRWQALRTRMLDRWASLATRTLDGSVQNVRVRLERALGGAGSYIATIRQPQ
jgi:hypothetical protein